MAFVRIVTLKPRLSRTSLLGRRRRRCPPLRPDLEVDVLEQFLRATRVGGVDEVGEREDAGDVDNRLRLGRLLRRPAAK